MSLSLRHWKAGLCWVAVSLSAAVFGQANFHTNNSEHALIGSRLGDQLHPSLSLNPGGGFLVWDDNAADGDGQGISAAALDSNFSIVQSTFRVNQTRAFDQELPQVSLLKNGGAVFVWQSGKRSAQRIYARFLSSSNAWATGEILVNPIAHDFQINPVVATLSDGSVVVAWSAFNQVSSTSLHDIYAQRFSGDGQKLGAAIPVNQFTSYNQRTPSLAALSDGRFVVTWISEQQRIDNSVDVFARVFNADTTPASDEFLVNTSVSNVCANPSVAGTDSGGFIVAWGEKNQFVLENGWDVYVRSYSAAGANAVQQLNSYVFGDQFAPRLATLAGGALAIWTSFGQDGSREGVFGRFLDPAGALSGNEFRINSITANSQMQPAIAADGASRFVTAWTTFAGVRNGFDLVSQQYASADFVPSAPATNYYPPAPDKSDPGTPGSPPPPPPGQTNGGPSAVIPVLAFPVIPSGDTVLPNALALAKGSYSGLFYETNAVATPSSGSFSARVTDDRGTFSATLLASGRKYTFSGRFDLAGNFSANLPRSSIAVSLQLDLTGTDQIRGTVSSGTWAAGLLANRAVFDKVHSPAPQAGNYTLIIPGDVADSSCPGGAGFGTVKVDGAGTVILAATLADGTKASQSAVLSKQGIWPLYISLSGGRGTLISWLQFTNQADSDLGGQLVWLKSAGLSKYYSHGFTNEVGASGSRYQVPAPGARALSMTQGNLVLSGGGMSQPMTNSLFLGLNNRATPNGASRLTLSITPNTGLFKGSVNNPATGKVIPFQGAVFKKANVGVGYFLGDTQSGEVYLSPAP